MARRWHLRGEGQSKLDWRRCRPSSPESIPGGIKESERKYYWQLGRRPDEYPTVSDRGY